MDQCAVVVLRMLAVAVDEDAENAAVVFTNSVKRPRMPSSKTTCSKSKFACDRESALINYSNTADAGVLLFGIVPSTWHRRVRGQAVCSAPASAKASVCVQAFDAAVPSFATQVPHR